MYVFPEIIIRAMRKYTFINAFIYIIIRAKREFSEVFFQSTKMFEGSENDIEFIFYFQIQLFE